MIKNNSDNLIESTTSSDDRDDIFNAEEIIVEELAIDGICGVY